MKIIKLTCIFCDAECDVAFDNEQFDDLVHFCPFCGDNEIEREIKNEHN